MATTKEKQPPYGNPQLNIRLEKEILDQLKAAAEKEGMTAQDWARRAILTSLGQDIPGGIGRGEFDDAIAQLKTQFQTELGQAKLWLHETSVTYDAIAQLETKFENQLGELKSFVADTAPTLDGMNAAIAPLKEEIETLKKLEGIE